jgi:hypothetical protein
VFNENCSFQYYLVFQILLLPQSGNRQLQQAAGTGLPAFVRTAEMDMHIHGKEWNCLSMNDDYR